ncbi:MAG: LacI family DNA-binding transcriptional regulator [Eubacteriales bacterium]|nr:LacI family DNA-binding transcriptional regulator [Eubacteriales bacterium]
MTISDIAKMAGVSKAAVSRYFNNGYVSAEKSEAIRRVVEETGYRPSLNAQMLRVKKSRLIGVIAPKMASSSISRAVEGILSVLDESEYQMLLSVTQDNEKKELDYFKIFEEQGVDGIIYFGTILTPAHKSFLKNSGVPVVMVGQHMTGVSCVYHDDYHCMKELTKKAINNGRTKPGYIGVRIEDKAVGEERYKGYCDALSEAGLEWAKENYLTADFNIRSGYEKAEEMLEMHPELDALICATDEIAFGAYRYMNDKHIRVPEQIYLSGHGDSDYIRVGGHAIATAHFDYRESGVEAARILLDKINDPGMSSREIKLGYYIVD